MGVQILKVGVSATVSYGSIRQYEVFLEHGQDVSPNTRAVIYITCLLYTSDAADE